MNLILLVLVAASGELLIRHPAWKARERRRSEMLETIKREAAEFGGEAEEHRQATEQLRRGERTSRPACDSDLDSDLIVLKRSPDHLAAEAELAFDTTIAVIVVVALLLVLPHPLDLYLGVVVLLCLLWGASGFGRSQRTWSRYRKEFEQDR